MVVGENEILNELIYYGMNTIFNKLSWLDKILAIDFAAKLRPDDLSTMVELIQLSFLRASPEEILEARIDIQGQRA